MEGVMGEGSAPLSLLRDPPTSFGQMTNWVTTIKLLFMRLIINGAAAARESINKKAGKL